MAKTTETLPAYVDRMMTTHSRQSLNTRQQAILDTACMRDSVTHVVSLVVNDDDGRGLMLAAGMVYKLTDIVDTLHGVDRIDRIAWELVDRTTRGAGATVSLSDKVADMVTHVVYTNMSTMASTIHRIADARTAVRMQRDRQAVGTINYNDDPCQLTACPTITTNGRGKPVLSLGLQVKRLTHKVKRDVQSHDMAIAR